MKSLTLASLVMLASFQNAYAQNSLDDAKEIAQVCDVRGCGILYAMGPVAGTLDKGLAITYIYPADRDNGRFETVSQCETKTPVVDVSERNTDRQITINFAKHPQTEDEKIAYNVWMYACRGKSHTYK